MRRARLGQRGEITNKDLFIVSAFSEPKDSLLNRIDCRDPVGRLPVRHRL